MIRIELHDNYYRSASGSTITAKVDRIGSSGRTKLLWVEKRSNGFMLKETRKDESDSATRRDILCRADL